MSISELYKQYSHLLILHGISKRGAIDSKARTLEERYRYSVDNSNKVYYSCHVLWHNKEFINWGCTGLILEDGEIISAFIGDGGTRTDEYINKMEDVEIKKVLSRITPEVLSKQWVELVIRNPIFKGVYFILNSEQYDCDAEEVMQSALSFGCYNLFEINKENGKIEKYCI